MNTTHLALTLALVLGCTPEDTEDRVIVGEHIDLEIEAGLVPCGDLVGHMDRFMELVAEVWQVELEGRHYTYRWYTQASYASESGCPEGSIGCAHSEEVSAYTAPLDHELVHLVSFLVGRPPSFFIEGAAVAFDLPSWSEESGLSDRPILDLLAIPLLPGGGYALAGAYTRHLIDRFGMSTYLEFYGALDRKADLETITAVHLDVFAEPLEDTIAAFDAERRDCEHQRFRFKLLECAAPAVAWTGDTLTLRRDISCAEDDVVGPFDSRKTARTYASFAIAEAGLFEISAASDVGGASITIGSCGGCESAAPITVLVGVGPQRVLLDAGPHYLRLDAAISKDTQLSLQLRRIE